MTKTNDAWQQIIAAIPAPLNSHFLGSTAKKTQSGIIVYLPSPTANIGMIRNQIETRYIRDKANKLFIYGIEIDYRLSLPDMPKPVPPPPPIRDTEGEFNLLMFQERSEKDVISFKRIFVDMTGDTLAGILLSHIVFWHTPNDKGQRKTRVEKDGHYWIAKSSKMWAEETTIKVRMVDKLIKKLVELDLIVTKNYMFDGLKMRHIRINQGVYVDKYHKAIRD